MRFAEIHPGLIIRLGPQRVDEAEILQFARSYDPQWFHTDPQRARSSRWGGLIASGWHTCAIAMKMVCEGPLRDSESIGSPGLAYVKWPAPVRPGDLLSLDITVIEARLASAKPLGIVKWRWELTNQAHTKVLQLQATSLFQVEPSAAVAL